LAGKKQRGLRAKGKPRKGGEPQTNSSGAVEKKGIESGIDRRVTRASAQETWWGKIPKRGPSSIFHTGRL